MSKCHSEDGRTLYPWTLEQEIAPIWDEYGAKRLGFRSFTLGKSGSKGKAAIRMSILLRENAPLLGGSRYTDLDQLLEEFAGQLQFALLQIAKEGIDRINEQTGSDMSARLTFWSFCRDFRNIKHFSNLWLGRTDVEDLQDLNRRKRKAEILREFASDLKQFAKQAAYLSGSDSDSNRRLEQALEIARTAMGQAQEDLQWMER